jgi:hypothetical protein
MRRITVLAVTVLGLGFVGQASAFAGSHYRDDCSSAKCNPFPAAAEKLGFSYFCGPHECINRRCPPYIYPNRAPRDFWMLR